MPLCDANCFNSLSAGVQSCETLSTSVQSCKNIEQFLKRRKSLQTRPRCAKNKLRRVRNSLALSMCVLLVEWCSSKSHLVAKILSSLSARVTARENYATHTGRVRHALRRARYTHKALQCDHLALVAIAAHAFSSAT